MMLRFYDVCHAWGLGYCWANPSDGGASIIRASKPRKPPTFTIADGWKWGDIVSHNVWSERLADVLKGCQATGYGAYPAIIKHKRKLVHGYMALFVSGKGGPIDPKRSKATFFDDGDLLHYESVFMDESKWDGTDVFTIPGLGFGIYIVGRVVKELKRIRPVNVSFTLSTKCNM